MNARSVVSVAAALLLLVVVEGCRTNNPPSPAPEPKPVSTIRPPAQPAADAGGALSPNDLAQRTAAYAQRAETADVAPATQPVMLAVAAPAVQPPPQPSAVQWTKAPAVAPAAETPAPVVAVAPQQVAVAPPARAIPPANTPQMNLVTHAVQSQPLNDVPVMLPESADFTKPPAPTPTIITMESRIAGRATANPHDISAQLDNQLLLLLRDEPAPSLSSITGLGTDDRELIASVIDGLGNFRSAVRAENNGLTSKKIRPILDMADRLRGQADLAIPTVALCKRIDGFGVYEPIYPMRFAAGREHPTLLYCEVENFASQLGDSRQWETRLTQSATLYTETGMEVSSEKPCQVTDHSRNRRHDFYLLNRLNLQANLTIGRYFLKVTVVDDGANRVAETTLPLEITAE